MKKLLLSIVFVAASMGAFAQIPKFGIKGGVNFANVSASSGSVSASFDNLTTFSVGAFADLKAGAISIQPGLFYTGKGFQFDNQIANETDKIKLFYLQVPVNFVYHAPIVVGNIYVGAGPFVAYGISGKSKATSGGTSIEEDITFGDGEDDIKRTEFGLQGIAGLQLKGGFLVGISYDLGLSNIANNIDGEGSVKNKVFGVSVGFTF
ncbi:PorT family protein [Mucilaginibacter sp. ZT4R22]|uniref:PorT family protein n=1 Tax=Mucilaginibacter pankratovii TaxID=2772110 RepID=A0ABR7WVK5_9SPHI|nr:porin family protein [Mucilaginibacter pankratovii]MBD1366316.1 PorT family protein [Mucilaginibacter pankratovii]